MVLRVDSLWVAYETTSGEIPALKNVSFQLKKAKTHGLAGESGCGKTTLGNAVMRLLPPEGRILSGHIRFHDHDLASLSEKEFRALRWSKLSMVFQGAMNAFNPVMRIEKQLAESIRVHRKEKRSCALRKAREMLSLVGINPEKGKRYPHEFSGGMKQRACIAMALMLQPEIVIADEPTTGLDVMIQAQVLGLLEDMKSDFDISLILISHDLAVLAETCDRITIMYGGSLIECGTTRDIFLDPRHPYTRGLLLSVPKMESTEELRSHISGTPPDLSDMPRGCAFRPRCPAPRDECQDSAPELQMISETHSVACYDSNSEDSWKT